MDGKTIAALAALAVFGAHAAETVDLNGAWSLTAFPQPDGGAVRALPLPADLEGVKTYRATVPGCCEMELVKTGELQDPLVGTNAFGFWAYEGHQWLYSRTFRCPVRAAKGERVVLAFDGIDTLADVFLNGEKVGEAKDGKVVLEQAFEVGANGRAELAKLVWEGQGMFLIDWTSDGGDGGNHYLHGEPPFKWSDYRAWIDAK